MMYFEIDSFIALRRALAEMCERLSDLGEGARFDSKLIASELVSNALRYGGGRAYLTVERRGDELFISVRGERGFRPPETTALAAADAEGGRGLYLVDALSVRREYDEETGIRAVLLVKED